MRREGLGFCQEQMPETGGVTIAVNQISSLDPFTPPDPFPHRDPVPVADRRARRSA